MSLILDGTNGLSDVDGSAATPAIRGTDANTGIFFPAADTIAFSEGGTEAMRIDSAGNLGIGTTSVANKLVVSASNPTRGLVAKISNSGASSLTGAQLHFEQNTIGDWVIGQPAGVDALAIWNNRFPGGDGSERMRIDTNGNLLIGTTSNPTTNRINVSWNNASFGGMRFSHASASYNQSAVEFYNASSTRVGFIYSNASSTQYSTSSDYRLKENIAPMTGALATVQALKPVTYNWKVDGSSGQGFIAHELQAVVPECVTGEKDAVDAEGNPQYQGIDTSFLVATLTAAIQELKATVDEQAARITALEGTAE